MPSPLFVSVKVTAGVSRQPTLRKTNGSPAAAPPPRSSVAAMVAGPVPIAVALASGLPTAVAGGGFDFSGGVVLVGCAFASTVG
jgi:hypothetical protein